MAEVGGRGGASVEQPENIFVRYLRECLLTLALQVVTVTYVAGLNPPGGVWPETKDGHLIGNPILAVTNHVRYNAFSCSNTAALVVSGAVVLLLLFVRGQISKTSWFNTVLRTVMSLGILVLAVAYAAGASRQKFTTNYASASVAIFFICVVIFIGIWICSEKQESSLDFDAARAMFSAIFVKSTAYTAGLSPPGAFRLDTQEGHLAGDPALPVYHRSHFTAFFIGNTMAFVGSLFIIPMALTDSVDPGLTFGWVYVCNIAAVNGLWIAYAGGTCIDNAYIAYVLLCAFVILIVMAVMVVTKLYIWRPIKEEVKELLKKCLANWIFDSSSTSSSHGGMDPFFIVLFTTISAAVTYQAGLNPPGGLWLDDLDGHKAGDPILLSKHPARYRVFVFCNSMALVTSLVSIVMAHSERCQTRRSHALDGLMLLDLVGLTGAYAAGCCRDVETSIHVISLGGAIIVYVVFHMAFLMPRHKLHLLIKDDKKVELDRDLILGILGAALTYQTGLTPPGGFWQSDDEFGHHAGEPVLLSTYPNRYKLFFYLNALCFMASIFLTVLFVNPLLYRAGIRCRALFICVLAVLLGLMGGYAAGSYRNLGTSIYIIVLGAAMFIFIISILYLLYKFPPPSNTSMQRSMDGKQEAQTDNQESEDDLELSKEENQPEESKEEEQQEESKEEEQLELSKEENQPEESKEEEQQEESKEEEQLELSKEENQPEESKEEEQQEESKKEKQNKLLMCLVLIGSIGACTTYQAGFAPPCGFWPDNSNGHNVGNPALRDIDVYRYRIFFFFNTTSFVASMFIMNLFIMPALTGQLDEVEEMQTVYTIVQAQTAVYTIGVMGAYAAGSSSGWNNTSIYVVTLVAPVLFCIFLIDPMINLFRKMAEKMKVFDE